MKKLLAAFCLEKIDTPTLIVHLKSGSESGGSFFCHAEETVGSVGVSCVCVRWEGEGGDLGEEAVKGSRYTKTF